MRGIHISFLITLGCLFACACTKPSTPQAYIAATPLADPEVRDGTEIYLGSDRYMITATKTSKRSKTKHAPVDTEFILTKSPDISVGVSGGMSTETDLEHAKVHEQNDAQSFVPASITKVLTTASALRALGADFKFKTRIGFELASNGQASNLTIESDGDPTVGDEFRGSTSGTQMGDFTSALKSKGVREIAGPITLVSSDPRVDAAVYAPGIPNEDMRACYGAMASTFNFRSNCAAVKVNAKNGFTWESPGIAEFMTGSLDTVAGDRTSLAFSPVLTAERILQGFLLRGIFLAKAPKNLRLEVPVGNAAGWYAQEFLKAAKAAKILLVKSSVKFASTWGERSAAETVFHNPASHTLTFDSSPLSQLVEATNKPSNNFLADSIFKAMGSRLTERSDASLQDGSRRKVRESLDAWLRADGHAGWSKDFAVFDGAGLSADNRATPRAFAAVLRSMSKEPTFSALWNSLPIAGVDGTLADRMKNTTAAGNVRGKTGTLSGAYQLVGFIPKMRGTVTEYVPFVILTATTVRNRDLVRRFQDAVVVKMFDTVNPAK